MTDELKTGYVTEGGNVVTPQARASFVFLDAPQQPTKDNGLKEAKYSVTLLFESDSDFKLLKEDLARACVETWGEDADKWPSPLKKPFRDQGEKTFEGYVPGQKMIIVTSKFGPELLGPNALPLDSAGQIQAGYWVRASVHAFTYKTGKNIGVSFGLNNVQLLRTDSKFGGGEAAKSQFKPVAKPGGGAAAANAGGASKASIFDD